MATRTRKTYPMVEQIINDLGVRHGRREAFVTRLARDAGKPVKAEALGKAVYGDEEYTLNALNIVYFDTIAMIKKAKKTKAYTLVKERNEKGELTFTLAAA